MSIIFNPIIYLDPDHEILGQPTPPDVNRTEIGSRLKKTAVAGTLVFTLFTAVEPILDDFAGFSPVDAGERLAEVSSTATGIISHQIEGLHPVQTVELKSQRPAISFILDPRV